MIVGRCRQGRLPASTPARTAAPDTLTTAQTSAGALLAPVSAALIRVAGLLALVAGLLAPAPAAAQVAALTRQCSAIPTVDGQAYCDRVALAVVAVQPRVVLAAAGGNPVAGTGSTVGLRTGSSPRVSLVARASGVVAETPRILDQAATGDRRFFLPGLGLDATVGLLEGLTLAPTVGGVLSLDALAGMALVPLPGDFLERGNLSWALGGRLGLLRESFTLPGVSVSLMYRRLGRVTFGDPRLVTSDGFFQGGLSALSLRAAASKHIYVVDVTAGLGLDRVHSDTRFGSTVFSVPYTYTVNGLETDRRCAFIDVGWTNLIWQVVGEVGWQVGPGALPAALPAGTAMVGSAPFVVVALRLTI